MAGHQRGSEQLRRRFLEEDQVRALALKDGVEVGRQAGVTLFVDVPTYEGDVGGSEDCSPASGSRGLTPVARHAVVSVIVRTTTSNTLMLDAILAAGAARPAFPSLLRAVLI
jgi:hypothetical protein